VYAKDMAKKRVHRKRMGRPPGRSYVESFPVRLVPEQARAIRAWAKQADMSISQAIRRLLERGLKK
jgi:predicted HicB family RNase H-like nuclease